MIAVIFSIISSKAPERRRATGSRGWATACLLVCLSLAGWLRAGPVDAVRREAPPRIQPDYRDIVIPPNIAPLNFSVSEAGEAFSASLRSRTGAPIEIESRRPTITIPEMAWHRLLELNPGADLLVEIRTRDASGQWTRFATITNHIARDPVDPFLIYRKIHPAHNTWSSMGLYQRDLRTFTETPILENRRFAGDCCHCHALRNNDPRTATVDIRSQHYENRLLIISNGVTTALRGTVGIAAWHPAGRVVASSFSKPRLMLHVARNDMRDIAELEGWLGYFQLGSNVVRRIPGLADETRLLAFPAWSPDGRFLYYCSAPNPWTNMARLTPTSHTLAKYDLMRVPYELEQDHWGRPETVLAAGQSGFSVAQPRLSPDGRWLFFCSIGYGCWPTYDRDSDLYGIDLVAGAATGKFTRRKLELNSDECESWLSWSTNSRWVVFSSKRISPLFNRPFFAHVAADGTCSKPFLLPQADPHFYDGLLRTYTIPTLAIGPLTVPERDLVAAIKDPTALPLVMPAAQASTKEELYEEGH